MTNKSVTISAVRMRKLVVQKRELNKDHSESLKRSLVSLTSARSSIVTPQKLSKPNLNTLLKASNDGY